MGDAAAHLALRRRASSASRSPPSWCPARGPRPGPPSITLCVLVSLLLGYFGLFLTATRETWVCIGERVRRRRVRDRDRDGSSWRHGDRAVRARHRRRAIGAHGLRSAAVPVTEAGAARACSAGARSTSGSPRPAGVRRHSHSRARSPPPPPRSHRIGEPEPDRDSGRDLRRAGRLADRRRDEPGGAAPEEPADRRRRGARHASWSRSPPSRTDGVARNDIGVAYVLLVSAAMLCIPAFAGQYAELQVRRYFSARRRRVRRGRGHRRRDRRVVPGRCPGGRRLDPGDHGDAGAADRDRHPIHARRRGVAGRRPVAR